MEQKRFTQKGFEEDYDLLLSIAQIVALLNLYTALSSDDSIKYLNTKSNSKDRRTIKKKQNLEDLCTYDATALNTLHTVLTILTPVLTKKGINVGWRPDTEEYVLLYRGKILELKGIPNE